MALAGFPLRQVSAHGGGGWRLGVHLFSDQLWHAANCSILCVVAWLAISMIPRRLWRATHWLLWLAFLPMCFCGISRMVYWWD